MGRRLAGPVVIALFIGLGGLFRFAPDVRTVDAAGLFLSGVAFGAGVVRLVLELRGRIRE